MSDTQNGTDSLTGLPAREMFEETLTTAIEELMTGAAGGERRGPVSLAFFDIDCFLQVNESSGRDAGDATLKAIAAEFGRQLPNGRSTLFRIGGDEFAVVMQETEKEQAFLALEQARSSLHESESLSGIEPRPTVSAGVASYPDDAGTRQELVRKADDALFRAKSTGKDRVILAREEKKVPKTSHYTQGQLDRLSVLATRQGVGEAELLREALDDLLKKYTS